jgi:hypothetical protein
MKREKCVDQNDKTRLGSQVVIERFRSRNSSLESLIGLTAPEFDPHEFIDELKIALSPTIEVREDVLHGKGAIDPFLWFGLAFTFASTAIATSILSKLGEDVYNHYKGKLLSRIEKTGLHERKKLKEILESQDTVTSEEYLEALLPNSKYLVELSLTIRSGNTFMIHGNASTESYETLVESMRSLASILDQVNKEMQQEPKKFHFCYEYDISTKKWVPAKHFTFTEGSKYDASAKKWVPTKPPMVTEDKEVKEDRRQNEKPATIRSYSLHPDGLIVEDSEGKHLLVQKFGAMYCIRPSDDHPFEKTNSLDSQSLIKLYQNVLERDKEKQAFNDKSSPNEDR